MKRANDPILVEQTFHVTLERVWAAITQLEEMKQWFFKNIESFEPEVGFKTSFIVKVDDRKFTHLWHLTEVIPNQKITYNWKYEEYPGDSIVSFRLFDEGSYVRLRLSHKVIEGFPEDIPEFNRESGIEGWNYFICESLKKYLDTIPK